MRDATHDTVSILKKPELVRLVEGLPQGYWPPRISRQSKAELASVVRRAVRDGIIEPTRIWQTAQAAC